MADYIVHYTDGKQERVPVYSELDVDDYRQEHPAPLPGAQVAWTKPYAGSNVSAVAYSMQWNNPRPKVVISSIDLVYGPDKVGVPALIAVTSATLH
jgi:beta-galactosidase